MIALRLEETVGTHPPPCTDILTNKNYNFRFFISVIQNWSKAQFPLAGIHVKMGKNLSDSPLRSVEKSFLEYSAKRAFLLKLKKWKTPSSKTNTSNWRRNTIQYLKGTLALRCTSMENLLDYVAACFVSRWGLKREFVWQQFEHKQLSKFTKQIWIWKKIKSMFVK